MSEGPDTRQKASILGRRQYSAEGPSPGNAGHIPLVCNKCNSIHHFFFQQISVTERNFEPKNHKTSPDSNSLVLQNSPILIIN